MASGNGWTHSEPVRRYASRERGSGGGGGGRWWLYVKWKHFLLQGMRCVKQHKKLVPTLLTPLVTTTENNRRSDLDLKPQLWPFRLLQPHNLWQRLRMEMATLNTNGVVCIVQGSTYNCTFPRNCFVGGKEKTSYASFFHNSRQKMPKNTSDRSTVRQVSAKRSDRNTA